MPGRRSASAGCVRFVATQRARLRARIRHIAMQRLLLASFSVLLLATCAFAQDPVEPVRRTADAAWNSQDWQTASASYKQVVKAEPKNGQAWHRLGYALHALGKLDEALEVHKRTMTFPQFAPTGAYNAACVHALQGNTDKAFEWLDKAVAVGMTNKQQFDGDSDLDSLRKDARFAKLMEKVAKSKSRPQLQVFSQTTQRKRNRVVWFGQDSSPGQFSIEYGAVPWQPKFGKAIGSEKFLGRKWRLGADFWTSLDTSLPMSIGGVDVPPGYYYLTLEQRDEQSFVLALHDAGKVKKQKLDAFVAHVLQGGIEVPMKHTAGNEVAGKLAIEIKLSNGQDKGQCRIAFGPHLLTAKALIDLGN